MRSVGHNPDGIVLAHKGGHLPALPSGVVGGVERNDLRHTPAPASQLDLGFVVDATGQPVQARPPQGSGPLGTTLTRVSPRAGLCGNVTEHQDLVAMQGVAVLPPVHPGPGAGPAVDHPMPRRGGVEALRPSQRAPRPAPQLRPDQHVLPRIKQHGHLAEAERGVAGLAVARGKQGVPKVCGDASGEERFERVRLRGEAGGKGQAVDKGLLFVFFLFGRGGDGDVRLVEEGGGRNGTEGFLSGPGQV
mmetsp:Transcript_56175/g.168150  ORF Transcript_56175/g.168150 Transcript_56175/m.168150 type:complete len:247 (-) Transcript_56175:779-1519(-)